MTEQLNSLALGAAPQPPRPAIEMGPGVSGPSEVATVYGRAVVPGMRAAEVTAPPDYIDTIEVEAPSPSPRIVRAAEAVGAASLPGVVSPLELPVGSTPPTPPRPAMGRASVVYPLPEARRTDMTTLEPGDVPHYPGLDPDFMRDLAARNGVGPALAASRGREEVTRLTDRPNHFSNSHLGEGGYNLASGPASNLDSKGKGATYGSRGTAGSPKLITGTHKVVIGGGENGTPPVGVTVPRTDAFDRAVGPSGKPVSAAEQARQNHLTKQAQDKYPQLKPPGTLEKLSKVKDVILHPFETRRQRKLARDWRAAHQANAGDARLPYLEGLTEPEVRAAVEHYGVSSADRTPWPEEKTKPRRRR